MEQKKIFSVSEVNRYVKMLFDSDELLASISIRGEITNFKAHYTGHYYFQTAQIDRGALCLKKISPVNQCIMDVEQIS